MKQIRNRQLLEGIGISLGYKNEDLSSLNDNF